MGDVNLAITSESLHNDGLAVDLILGIMYILINRTCRVRMIDTLLHRSNFPFNAGIRGGRMSIAARG